ncbi:MAG: peptidylprolyl isomerase [Planctomycetes bacterium]|nr:peptidylprolyl isomerase [Planctomycetota bacterium]
MRWNLASSSLLPTSLCLCLQLCFAGASTRATAQQPAPPAAGPSPQSQNETPTALPFVTLQWPKDKATAIATIGGKHLTLQALIDHLDERHFPGLRKAFDEPQRAEIHRYLTSDLIAVWVRHFADLHALRAEAESRKVDTGKAEATCAAALKSAFESWLQGYVDNLREQGHPTELSQQRVNRLLADFQLRQGLACEVQGWLDLMEPDTYTNAQLGDFYKDYPRYFGGRLKFAHILIQHRDPGTGILLTEQKRAAALARLSEVQARVRAEGADFAEIARLFSEDNRTAPHGGLLEGVHRFDEGLPAALCRTAWSLADGETSDVVESQYGLHVVHRIECDQRQFFILTEGALPTVRLVMRRAMQENLLFGARERYRVELKL